MCLCALDVYACCCHQLQMRDSRTASFPRLTVLCLQICRDMQVTSDTFHRTLPPLRESEYIEWPLMADHFPKDALGALLSVAPFTSPSASVHHDQSPFFTSNLWLDICPGLINSTRTRWEVDQAQHQFQAKDLYVRNRPESAHKASVIVAVPTHCLVVAGQTVPRSVPMAALEAIDLAKRHKEQGTVPPTIALLLCQFLVL